MILSWGVVAYDGAWLHHFRHEESAAAASRGGRRASLACSFPRCARSIRGGGCFSSIRCARTSPASECPGCDRRHRSPAARGGVRFRRRRPGYDRHSRLQPARLRLCARDPARRDPDLCGNSLGLARIRRGPFGGAGDRPQPLHDHRALPSRARSGQLCRQDLSPWRRRSPSAGCSRSRAPARPPARRCSTCCCRLRRRARIPKSAG